jgi:hypothetical protein
MHSRQQAGQRLAVPVVTIAAKHSSQARMQVWQASMQGWFFMTPSLRINRAGRRRMETSDYAGRGGVTTKDS